jgi:hypothetical protein
MRLPRVRFMIRWVMAVVAIVACSTWAAVAFSIEPRTARTVLAAWAALYGIPAMLILARGVPLGKAVKIVRRIVLFGLPVAGFYGLLGFALNGGVGLIGGFTSAALLIGWGALLAAGLSGDKAVSPEV